MIGIVILQYRVNGQAVLRQLSTGIAVRIAAGRVRGAVGSIAAHREDGCPFQTGNARRGGKGDLLIPAAFSVTGQLYHGFPAGNEGQGFGIRGMCFQDGGKEASGFPGLTAELIREDDGLIAQIPAGGGRSGAKLPDAAVAEMPGMPKMPVRLS